MSYLLDTHVVLYWLEQQTRLSARHAAILDEAALSAPLYLAEISLWEIATLYSLGRIGLRQSLRDFLEQLVALPILQTIRITPAIAAEVAALPDSFHRDPGDRLIVASARVLGATLLTRDERIIGANLVATV